MCLEITPTVRVSPANEFDVRIEERRAHSRDRRNELIARVANTAIRWIGASVIVYFGYRSIRVLAGAETHADIALRLFGKFWVSEGLMGLFGVGGITFGVKQRNLRRGNIERLGPRLAQYETVLDPQRSSSRLTVRGETNPEDVL